MGAARHDEGHQSVGDDARRDREQVARRRKDLAEPAARVDTRCRPGRRAWGPQGQEDRDREEGKGGVTDEASRERRARHRVAGPDHELRPDDRRDQSADHDAGNGLVPERAGRAVRGGEAVGLDIRGVEAGGEGAEAEHGEGSQSDAERRGQTRRHADGRADDVAGPAAEVPHDEGRRQGADGKAEVE